MLPAATGFAKRASTMLARFGSDRWLAAFFLVATFLTLVALGAQRHLSSFDDALERRHALNGRVDSLVRLRQALAEDEVAQSRLATFADPEAHTQREQARTQVLERLRQLQASYAGTVDPPDALSRIQSTVTREFAHAAPAQQAIVSPGASAAAVAAYRARHAWLDADLAELAHTQQMELARSERATHMRTREFVQGVTWVTGAGVLLVLALGALHARGARTRVHAHDRAAEAQCGGVHLDIPDGRRAEQERSTVQRRLQHIICSIRDGFVTLDRDWNYTYANDAAAQLLGRSREDLIGHNVWALFPEMRHLPFHDACVRCMQQREPVQLDQYFAPHYRWYRNHFYPTDDGIAIFFEDFTARKRLEAQLADERERYRATFEQPAIGILHVALEGTITRCNARMAEMLGYERLDLVGLDFAGILAEPQPGLFLEDVQDPACGGARRLVQCRFRQRDGECFWGEMTLAFVPAEGERSGYVVCMVQDIDDRKRAEALLDESRRRLDAFAQQLTEAIEQERARISREIHDELGQALTRLKMDLGWLRRRLGESGQTAGAVATRVVEMGHFIDETLVSVRRLATELRPALLDNLDLAAALNAQMRQLGAQADIEVTQHLEPDLPLTSEQATGLYRIAQEAVTNIARHAGARNVRCVLFRDGDGVTMEIQDDGCGFDLSLPRQRGLGLVGIAERARLLGGSAAVESETGRGTLVRVHLPTATAERGQMAG